MGTTPSGCGKVMEARVFCLSQLPMVLAVFLFGDGRDERVAAGPAVHGPLVICQ